MTDRRKSKKRLRGHGGCRRRDKCNHPECHNGNLPVGQRPCDKRRPVATQD